MSHFTLFFFFFFFLQVPSIYEHFLKIGPQSEFPFWTARFNAAPLNLSNSGSMHCNAFCLFGFFCKAVAVEVHSARPVSFASVNTGRPPQGTGAVNNSWLPRTAGERYHLRRLHKTSGSIVILTGANS